MINSCHQIHLNQSLSLPNLVLFQRGRVTLLEVIVRPIKSAGPDQSEDLEMLLINYRTSIFPIVRLLRKWLSVCLFLTYAHFMNVKVNHSSPSISLTVNFTSQHWIQRQHTKAVNKR